MLEFSWQLVVFICPIYTYAVVHFSHMSTQTHKKTFFQALCDVDEASSAA